MAAAEESQGRRPRLLVTGFSVFPGAPVNPTEWLARALQEGPPEGVDAFRAEVLPVEYATVPTRLSEIGSSFRPDIAIHFGLAHGAHGFRLERTARNAQAARKPDNAGRMPAEHRICAGPETLPSGLPLDRIAETLAAAGLPYEFSDDAGGYLCNMVFMLSSAHACDGFAPSMTGFVHVPAFPEDALPGQESMTRDDLLKGAYLIIAAALKAWTGR